MAPAAFSWRLPIEWSRAMLMLVILASLPTAWSGVVDLSWASAATKLNGSTFFGPGTVVANATFSQKPVPSFWVLQPGARLVFHYATILTTCEALDGLQALASPNDKQVLPAPAVWISNLTVNSANGAVTTYLSTAFSCVPAELACRGADQPATPVQAQAISSGWQLVAALAQVSRASSQAAGCLSPWEYTFQLAANISLMDLRTANQFTAPMKPYVISSSITIQPAVQGQLTVLDLAEVWNLTRVVNDARMAIRDLTLVNLATAPPVALAFPVWAVQLPSRNMSRNTAADALPIQLSGCTLIVPQDEWDFLTHTAETYDAQPFFRKPKGQQPYEEQTGSSLGNLTVWPRYAIVDIENYDQLDNQTASFEVFNGLSVVMSNVVFTTQALPGFPLMHNETGLGRLFEECTGQQYPSVIMITNEQMLLDYMQPARVAEALNTMALLNFGAPNTTSVVLALTQSFNLTPSLWRNGSGPFVVLDSFHVTIAAWPQSLPITLGMGNTPGLIKIGDDHDAASLTFLDLILTDLPVKQPWSSAITDIQANEALQGAILSVDLDRISGYVTLKRVEMLVSEEELALRVLCGNRTAMDQAGPLMSRCLAAQLYLRDQQSVITENHMAVILPDDAKVDLYGYGTCLKQVTFTSVPETSPVISRPDLMDLIEAWLAPVAPPATASPASPGWKPKNFTEGYDKSQGDTGMDQGQLIGVIIGVVGGAVLLALAAAGLTYCVIRKRKNAEAPLAPGAGEDRKAIFGDKDQATGGSITPASDSLPGSQSASEDHGTSPGPHVALSTARGPSHATQPSYPLGTHAPAHAWGPGGGMQIALVAVRSIQASSAAAAAELASGTGPSSSAGGSGSGLEQPIEWQGSIAPLGMGELEEGGDSRVGRAAPQQASRSPSGGLSSADATLSSTEDTAKEERVRRPSLVSELAALTQDMEAKICDKRLEISDAIGSGGYSTVYRGLWQGLSVAVKTVIFARGGDNKTMALQEAAISKSINHPNIVATYAYDLEPIGPKAGGVGLLGGALQLLGNHGGAVAADGTTGASTREWRLYLVMEYCDGGCLKNLIRAGALLNNGVPNMVPILELAYQVAQGMLHLHSKQIIHGDLKPENVLLKSQGGFPSEFVAKVADFGLSVSMSEPQSHVSNWLKGTPFYVSPEVCGAQKLSKASDVFSYGVMLWELYHSRLVWRHGKDGPETQPDFPAFPATAPEPYILLVKCCIQRDPAFRPTFAQISGVLHHMIRAVPAQQQPQPLQQAVTTQVHQERWQPSLDGSVSHLSSSVSIDIGEESAQGSSCVTRSTLPTWQEEPAMLEQGGLPSQQEEVFQSPEQQQQQQGVAKQ